MQLPTTTLYKILMKKKESMEAKAPKKSADIAFKSQKDAELAWLKETQDPETIKQINMNSWKI